MTPMKAKRMTIAKSNKAETVAEMLSEPVREDFVVFCEGMEFGVIIKMSFCLIRLEQWQLDCIGLAGMEYLEDSLSVRFLVTRAYV